MNRLAVFRTSSLLAAALIASTPAWACQGKLYLTLDTGNMSQADLIAQILRKHEVKASFFLANEKTKRGDYSLDNSWAPYWQARVKEGHVFGNHTFDHVYFRGEPDKALAGNARFAAKPQFGAQAGQQLHWNDAQLCQELGRVQHQFQSLTGRALSAIWRAPGGKAPASVMSAAKACGYAHVFWARAGFLGDELPSESFPNQTLLKQALRDIRDGDILMAHLGIWSRKDPYAPMLDPLIAGLKEKGFCFATLLEHPDYR